MTAYYNELDPFAAQWLRNLISAGHWALTAAEQKRKAAVERAGGRYNVIETNDDARKLVGL